MARASVNVKLVPQVEVEKTLGSLRELDGVVAVIHTFPEEDDDELRRLAIVEVEPERVESVLRALGANPALEYAAVAPRRGVRPRL